MATSDNPLWGQVRAARLGFEQLEDDFLTEAREVVKQDPDAVERMRGMIARFKMMATQLDFDREDVCLTMVAMCANILAVIGAPGRSMATTISITDGLDDKMRDALFALWLGMVIPAERAATPMDMIATWNGKVAEWRTSTTTEQ